jgi:hypothetical protein
MSFLKVFGIFLGGGAVTLLAIYLITLILLRSW